VLNGALSSFVSLCACVDLLIAATPRHFVFEPLQLETQNTVTVWLYALNVYERVFMLIPMVDFLNVFIHILS
jgi:hypothetical protein